MTLDTIVMLAGTAVLVLQFLGFPQALDNVFYFILGIFILGLGVAVRRNVHKALAEKKATRRTDVFIENTSLDAQKDQKAAL